MAPPAEGGGRGCFPPRLRGRVGWGLSFTSLVDVHVALPNGHRGVTLGQLTQITEVAEELGFNGVWPLDHVLVGPDLKDRYPWVIEPLTLLGYLAARTSRIRLGTSVIVLAMRNPFVVAKQAATLDLLSNGRFTLGLGAGYSEPEFRNVGASGVWHTRQATG